MSRHINIADTDIYIAPIGNLDTLIAKATPQQMQLIAEVVSPRRQAEILATRQLVCETLGPQASIGHNPDGSPNIIGSDLNISISHSRDYVAIALNARQCIGIDIESWRNSLNTVREKFLTPTEIAIYNTPELLLQAWTAKEAIYKAAGITGLPFHDINLPSDPTSPTAKVLHSDTAPHSRHTHIFTLHTHTTADFTLTLAYK